jgi:CRP-like cAMP-binding protein
VFVQTGDVDVVIAGGGGSDETYQGDDVVSKQDNKTVIKKGAGWLFGDLTLLFNSARTASVVAATDTTVWCLDKHTFLQVRPPVD